MRLGNKFSLKPIYRRQRQLLKLTIFAMVTASLALSASLVGVNGLRAEGLDTHDSDTHSLDSHSSDLRAQSVTGTLRNVEFLPKVCSSRPPARPRKFLRRRNLQTQVERDEKYLQLLVVSIGFVGMLIIILVLRSMPPAKKSV